MTLTCVVVDDEYLAIRILEDYISRSEDLHLSRTFRYPAEAVLYLKKHQVDLLFLDIQMPELDGFAVLSELEDPPMVVFTTARPDYAVQAFELNVLDYLLKPISFERFRKSVEKAVEYSGYVSLSGQKEQGKPDYLMINADYQVHKIRFNDILWIEGLSEYVKIHCIARTYVTLASLKGLEEKLEGFAFLRVHKSFIVNEKYIGAYQYSEIELQNGKKIPVGRSYRKNINFTK